MKQILATFLRDNGTEQKVDITHVDFEWIKQRASQIDFVEYKNVTLNRPCEKCGEVEQIRTGGGYFLPLCSNCFKSHPKAQIAKLNTKY